MDNSQELLRAIHRNVFAGRARAPPPLGDIEVRHYGNHQFSIHCARGEDGDLVFRWLADGDKGPWSARVFDGFEYIDGAGPVHDSLRSRAA